MSNTKRKNNDKIQDAKVENFQAAVWATYVGWRSTRGLNQHNFRHTTFRLQPTLLKLIQLVCCNQIRDMASPNSGWREVALNFVCKS